MSLDGLGGRDGVGLTGGKEMTKRMATGMAHPPGILIGSFKDGDKISWKCPSEL